MAKKRSNESKDGRHRHRSNLRDKIHWKEPRLKSCTQIGAVGVHFHGCFSVVGQALGPSYSSPELNSEDQFYTPAAFQGMRSGELSILENFSHPHTRFV